MRPHRGAWIIGTVGAFYALSSGSMPRRLVDDRYLPWALALNGVGSRLVSMAGGPAGGALVAVAGFAAAPAADSVSFAAVLAALIAVRPTAYGYGYVALARVMLAPVFITRIGA